MQGELVSIVVPVYNVEKYLERCIESLIKQTYISTEILLIDDGSTDDSGKLCDSYAVRVHNIFCYHKSNGGLSDARNYGIEKAKGKYICFVDSDDCINTTFVETLYKLILEYDVKISAVGFKRFYENKEIEQKLIKDERNELLKTKEAIYYLFSEDKFCNFAWNKMYEKDLFLDVSFPFGRKMEDLGSTFKLFNKCEEIAYNSSPLYYYFQRDDSILHTRNEKFYKDMLFLTYERFIALKEKYPDMQVNDDFALRVLLDTYPYINRCDKLEKISVGILKGVSNNCFNVLTMKKKLKYLVFRMNKPLYRKIFRRKIND